MAQSMTTSMMATKNMAVRCDVPEPVVISDEAKAEAEEKKDVLDPADGTVAYGGPMGEDGTENLNAFGETFFNWRSAFKGVEDNGLDKPPSAKHMPSDKITVPADYCPLAEDFENDTMAVRFQAM
eukprot:gene4233-5213_t